ncbi:MAG: glycosyltransferase family 2 protein [Bordetella sp.]|uniref:glycosyltransferase family 2 protein n=1 Tax=Bordetella sp. TaxID=28081 RepID=UPI003F7BDD19
MQTEYLLSIVTVTKNCADTIDKTLDSVAAVKDSRVEYVVVDGVSTDDTLERVRARGGLIDRLVSEPDTGIYNAMNKGVTLARGHYVLFINGDDRLAPEGFPTVMPLLEAGQDPIVCAGMRVMNTAEGELPAVPWKLPFFCTVHHPALFAKRELLLQWPFREDLRIASDYDFFLRAYVAGVRFRPVPVMTALHWRGGASGNVARSVAETRQVQRERLGWRYPLYGMVLAGYRVCKRLGLVIKV